MSYPYHAHHESYIETNPHVAPPIPQTGQYPPPGYSGGQLPPGSYPDPTSHGHPSSPPPQFNQQQQFYQPQQVSYPSPGPAQYAPPPAQPQQVYVVQEKPPPPIVYVTQQPPPAQQPVMVVHTQSDPGKVTKQPKPKADMVVKGNRNCKNKPFGPQGTREWSTGLCDCMDENCGTCCLATWCPCIVYGQNKARFEYLSSHDSPDPSGGGSCCSGDCSLHGCLTSFCAFGWALQISTRSAVRQRYKIDGSWFGDCLAACCCSPCQLAQEDREISLEENSFPRGVGLSTGANYHGTAKPTGGKPGVGKVGK